MSGGHFKAKHDLSAPNNAILLRINSVSMISCLNQARQSLQAKTKTMLQELPFLFTQSGACDPVTMWFIFGSFRFCPPSHLHFSVVGVMMKRSPARGAETRRVPVRSEDAQLPAERERRKKRKKKKGDSRAPLQATIPSLLVATCKKRSF